jgi:CRISPR-associated exonuclease Cas4
MIRASDLARSAFCPRLLYLTDVVGLREPQTPELLAGRLGHAVRRQLSLRQPRILQGVCSAENAMDVLRQELDDVISEIGWRHEYGPFMHDVRSQVRMELARLGEELDAMTEDLGFEAALRYATPWRTDHYMSSSSLRLCGVVDKVMLRPGPVPLELRTGAVSERGFDSERLQLCAYGMLLEDELNRSVDFGLIEYARSCERRPIMFSPALREAVLTARGLVEGILGGAVPGVCPHGEPRRCQRCGLAEECYRI